MRHIDVTLCNVSRVYVADEVMSAMESVINTNPDEDLSPIVHFVIY